MREMHHPIRPKGPYKAAHPFRQVVRRSHGGYVAQFPSRKSPVPLECEELLELDFARLCEVDPRVTAIMQQPCELIWLDQDRRKHRHIPDFAVVRDARRYLFEVKPWKRSEETHIKMRTKTLTADLARVGVGYRIITERTIRAEPALSRAKMIIDGLGVEPTDAERSAVKAIVGADPAATSIAAVCDAMHMGPSFSNVVLNMILKGDLEIADAPDRSTGAVGDAHVRLRRTR